MAKKQKSQSKIVVDLDKLSPKVREQVLASEQRRTHMFSVRHKESDVIAWKAAADKEMPDRRDALPAWIEAHLNNALTADEADIVSRFLDGRTPPAISGTLTHMAAQAARKPARKLAALAEALKQAGKSKKSTD